MLGIFIALLNTDLTFTHSFDLFVRHCGQAVIHRYVSVLPHALFESIKFVVEKT